jgi:tetratricopeptide (TPR) repeat protein
MYRVTILLILTSFFSFSQNTERLRDSIVKYRNSNPSLAVEFGIQYTNDDFSKIPNAKTSGTHALIGEILLEMQLYVSALNYFNRSIDLYNSIPESERKNPVDQPPWVILNIGNVYLRNGELDKAKSKYHEAKQLFKQFLNKEEKQFGLNTSDSNLALILEKEGDFDAAEKIYHEIYQRRLKSKKTEDILYSLSQIIAVKLLKKEFISAENKLQEVIQIYNNQKTAVPKTSVITRNYGYSFVVFAAYYQSIRQYENAIKYLNKAKIILKYFPSEINALGSRFAECYLGLDDFEKAKKIANENLKIKNLNETEKRYNYKVLEKIYKKKDFKSELLKIKDSLILISSGSNPGARILKTLNNLEIQIQLANSAREMNNDRIKYNTYLYILIICSIILFFSLITIKFNYNFQKEKGNRLEAEKNLIYNELEEKNRELVSKSNFILQRNEFLKKIQTKLEASDSSVNNLKSASYELNSVINSEKSHKDFERVFVSVYPNYFKTLNNVAKLTTTDLRLAAFIKMNHTNSEIAIISGVSSRTIESQRYRLSKKLNLNKEDSLNSFLLSI